MDWATLLTNELLEKCGKNATTLSELTQAVAVELNNLEISPDALWAAHKRYKARNGLKTSLAAYLTPKEEKPVKRSRIKPEDLKFTYDKDKKQAIKQKDKFIITSAMNNCAVDKDVWASITTYAQHNNAEIIVIPIRYKNPTSQLETKNQEDAWWAEEVVPFLTDELVKLNDNLWVMGHVRIQATATHPLSSLEAMSHSASAIYGHSQLAMTSVPTTTSNPKILYTTGSCTKSWYSDSKAGVKAKFHHTNSAVVVELDGNKFFIRSVSMDRKGGFYDLDNYYSSDSVQENQTITALITGDEHAIFTDAKVKAATYKNKDSIVNVLKPKMIVRHDVFDGYSISHHNRKDPIIQYMKHQQGQHLVEEELKLTARHIDETTPEGAQNIIVASNHHDHLLRWLKEVSAPQDEPWNAKIWLELWQAVINSVDFKKGVNYCDPWANWTKSKLKSNTKFLKLDESFKIGDIEIGLHGHTGFNGSKGSVGQYSKLGVKTISAHSHTPSLMYGAYRVGTSSNLRLDYTKGPSSWAHAHCIIHPNNKRQIIIIVDGKWRG